jgi:Ion channel.
MGQRGYWRVLATILLAYAAIIALADAVAGSVVRLALLGYLLWEALRLSGRAPAWSRYAAWVGTALALVVVAVVDRVAPAVTTSGVVGGVSLGFTAAIIAIFARAVITRRTVDTSAVLGVLSVYLLLALFFASLNQLLAAFDPGEYLNGVAGLPSAADQLYFSVITMATVGFGDITPAGQVARAVTVVEALAGQLYLVSVVAAVVGLWRRRT